SCLHSSTSFYLHHPSLSDIYTLSLHDALPICWVPQVHIGGFNPQIYCGPSKSYKRIDAQNSVSLKSMKVIGEAGSSLANTLKTEDRKSTRLNSSHVKISYAVFCLKKKKKKRTK